MHHAKLKAVQVEYSEMAFKINLDTLQDDWITIPGYVPEGLRRAILAKEGVSDPLRFKTPQELGFRPPAPLVP
jgi:hypothetical protein